MQKDCRLGELLVGMGLIDEGELRAMLSLQAELRAHHRSRLPGMIDKRFRLGTLLVESGVIDEQVLNDVLARQKRMLAQAALVSAALSAVTPAAAAGDMTHLNIVATVLTRASIESQELPRDVTISEQDVERGYVDLDPIAIGVQSNHAAGVRLWFVATSARFTSVDVEGGGATLFLVQQGRGLQRQKVSVRLRLRLAPGAAPGTIAYPVSVSLTPA
jgi:hypothetical protein